MDHPSNKPKYLHDCSECQFQGHWIEADWYVCDPEKGVGTVIKRLSNEGFDYSSTPIDMLEHPSCSLVIRDVNNDLIPHFRRAEFMAVLELYRKNKKEY